MNDIDQFDFERLLTVERNRAHYAWKNVRILQDAYLKERLAREAAEAECRRLHELLDSLARSRQNAMTNDEKT